MLLTKPLYQVATLQRQLGTTETLLSAWMLAQVLIYYLLYYFLYGLLYDLLEPY